MSSFEWSHNDFYHRLLLRHLPRGCERVLDVGCGAGRFAAELAGRVGHVDAIDRSPGMIDAAKAVAPANVTCILDDFLEHEFPERSYDAIFSVTAIHHMPLEYTLSRMATLLRPGGVLAAIALPKSDLPRELPVELVAAAGQRVFGLAFAAARAAGGGGWHEREPEHDEMPVVLDPTLTTRAVQETATRVLPGARVRRLVFWRYLLTWRKTGA
ncbi:class I SAM-dependent methyltransferase [Amycolatopsis sp. CA-230715]|uniref:class I SAM-dependent methyltransferase n=1 Tax=Amycolatopsis sp. CA-230715 TaxID=2745196 RepID=UPI001C01A38C|nr:class I SAM-dependent methyltransferase [Amycolatopsis sp. CA-230715]